MRDRDGVERLADRVSDYVNRNARGADGGVTIEDDFPAGAYVAAHLTGDLARHAAALTRISPRVRLFGVRFTEEQLGRISDRLVRQLDGLERDGIDVAAVGTNESDNTVEMELISSRPDAVEVVERRFGPPVRAIVIATSRYREVCAHAIRYRVGPSGRTVKLKAALRGRRVIDAETGRRLKKERRTRPRRRW